MRKRIRLGLGKPTKRYKIGRDTPGGKSKKKAQPYLPSDEYLTDTTSALEGIVEEIPQDVRMLRLEGSEATTDLYLSEVKKRAGRIVSRDLETEKTQLTDFYREMRMEPGPETPNRSVEEDVEERLYELRTFYEKIKNKGTEVRELYVLDIRGLEAISSAFFATVQKMKKVLIDETKNYSRIGIMVDNREVTKAIKITNIYKKNGGGSSPVFLCESPEDLMNRKDGWLKTYRVKPKKT